MDLSALEPQFLLLESPGSYQHVGTIAEADGVLFLCPVCFRSNGGEVGTHSVICWAPKVPLTESPGPGRWRFSGTGYADLTLAPSISLPGDDGCRAHFFVRNGQIVFA